MCQNNVARTFPSQFWKRTWTCSECLKFGSRLPTQYSKWAFIIRPIVYHYPYDYAWMAINCALNTFRAIFECTINLNPFSFLYDEFFASLCSKNTSFTTNLKTLKGLCRSNRQIMSLRSPIFEDFGCSCYYAHFQSKISNSKSIPNVSCS